MQNLHYDSKDSESRLKIDVRIAFTLDSRGNGVTGVRFRVSFGAYTSLETLCGGFRMGELGYLSINFNTHSPCFSVPAVKPKSVQVDFALSILDEEEVDDFVVGVDDWLLTAELLSASFTRNSFELILHL